MTMSEFAVEFLRFQLCLGKDSRRPGSPSLLRDIYHIFTSDVGESTFDVKFYRRPEGYVTTTNSLEMMEEDFLKCHVRRVGISFSWDRFKSHAWIVRLDEDRHFKDLYKDWFTLDIKSYVEEGCECAVFRQLCLALRPYTNFPASSVM